MRNERQNKMNRKQWRTSLFSGDVHAARRADGLALRPHIRAMNTQHRLHGLQLFDDGMALLLSIHEEEKAKLTALWETPDASEFFKKVKPIAVKTEAQMTAILDEFAPMAKPAKEYFTTREQRMEAKAEVNRALAQLAGEQN